MTPRSYSTEGIVLARRNYSEADRILSIFTKDHGRVGVLAKGVRKPSSKKRGHLEIFSHVRFSAIKGRGIDLISEAEIIDNFTQVRANLKKVSLAYYFMEVVGRTTHENETHEEVFRLIIEYLNKLKNEKELKKLRLNFVLELLTTLGFWPKGKPMPNPDAILEEVVEREFSSLRVGKKLVS